MSTERDRRKLSGMLSADAVIAAFQAQSALLEKFITMARSPNEPLVINAMLRKTIETCMFATLFFGVLDPKNGKLVYINGGHETVFVIERNGIRERLLPTGPAVGLIPEAKFEFKQVQLKPGEILFTYTDGVIDARSPRDERFTRKRLISLLSQPAATALELMERIGTSLFAHIGKAPQEDDITMLTVQRKN